MNAQTVSTAEPRRPVLPYGVGVAMTRGRLLPWERFKAVLPKTIDDLARRARRLKVVG